MEGMNSRKIAFFKVMLEDFCIFAADSGNAGVLARHRCGRGRPRSQAKQLNNR